MTDQQPPVPPSGAPTPDPSSGPPSYADRFSPPDEREPTVPPASDEASGPSETGSGDTDSSGWFFGDAPPPTGEPIHSGPAPVGPLSTGPQFGPPAGATEPTAQFGPGELGTYPPQNFGPREFPAVPLSPLPPLREPASGRGGPRRLLAAVVATALVVGLIGGALGALIVNSFDDSDQPGRTSGGLDDVELGADPLPADNGSIVSVADKLLPSTVQIMADFDGQQGGATGSGFLLDKQGHVVTNNHVIEDAASSRGSIEVIDHEGQRYDASVVGRSPVYDLAVLYVEDLKGAEPASLGSSRKLRIGENVVAIGAPLGLGSTVTSGIVSALDRPVTTGDSADDNSYINAVQTDAAINPGNSGGPLVNMRGQVVGVNSAIATTGGSAGGESGSIGVGFAIPVEQVRVTADQILKDGEAQYPVIGAQVRSDGSGRGADIESVEGNSPAADAGIKAGDVVTELDGRLVTDSPTLIVAIRTHVPGDQVTLTVQRDGDEKQFTVTLDGRVG